MQFVLFRAASQFFKGAMLIRLHVVAVFAMAAAVSNGADTNRSCVKLDTARDAKSLFYSESRGRLGNCMLMYALMLQLKISLNVETATTDECIGQMRRHFAEDSLHVLALSEICDVDNFVWEDYNRHIRDLLYEKSYRTGRRIHLFPMLDATGNKWGYKVHQHESPEHDKLVIAYRRNMRRTLRFKPEVVDRVNAIYDDVAKKMGRPRKDIYFVGIHNRRTDYNDWLMNRENVKPIKPKYFYDAMDEYREDVDPHFAVAFLFVSDDMEWGRRNIKDKYGDLFFVGNGVIDEVDGVATDLATMAFANGTIMSRGTFSLWCVNFSGNQYYTEYGWVIPDHINNPEGHPDDEEYYL